MIKAHEVIEKLNYKDKVRYGQVFSTDVFYKDNPDALDWVKMGVIAIEMEAYALFLNAARAGKGALCFCGVSDNVVTGEALSAEERVNFDDMIVLALETAIALEE